MANRASLQTSSESSCQRVDRQLEFPGFSSGGYGFQILDPALAHWGQDWYDLDDVYADCEDDAYYRYNRSHPGSGIAVNIDFKELKSCRQAPGWRFRVGLFYSSRRASIGCRREALKAGK